MDECIVVLYIGHQNLLSGCLLRKLTLAIPLIQKADNRSCFDCYVNEGQVQLYVLSSFNPYHNTKYVYTIRAHAAEC